MSCGRIRRWILRNGGDELPVRWREHVAGCEKCRTVVAQVDALDGALSEGAVPDPGEAYWSAFAPAVARRIDELAQIRRPMPATIRPWLKVWAPALGVAALALLIARELVIDPRPRPVMETDIPVVSQKPANPAVATEAASDLPEMAATRTPENQGQTFRREPVLPEGTEKTESDQPSAAAGDRPGLARQSQPAVSTPERDQAENELRPSPALPDADESVFSELDDEDSVWPDRRVTKMGAVDSDQTREAIEAEGPLAEQGAPGIAERPYSLASAGAETSATLPPLGRLEAPRTVRDSRAPDSQSPMDAMRRFDELRELRVQIATLTSVGPDARTPEQNRELCAMWYRMGTITDDALVLDSAIQQLSHCLETLDVAASDEWQAKSHQLSERRLLFNQE